MIRYAICLCALPLLSACGDDPAPVAADDDARSAEGNVLEGSISDAMIPLDELQSTSPAVRETSAADDSRRSAPAAQETPEPEAEPAEPAPEADAE
ncbi:hypothetical protein QWY75_08255 [Pontixanthobacter aestiaquae]|uniref:Uncharacterized protein n=1 Tax=Pontixanthobacter aestiaquae TaxID=1509367 RepID=A0A844Z284_9SPHN|nr:hypothetical protein [Pontixanthobacter aestiaquae]MDN3646197.1 hypothetical protein [Pontixanthobacter aestiaquae]MXO82811.1 hypothetical protein [Pontixanthobacter aestiaquae]